METYMKNITRWLIDLTRDVFKRSNNTLKSIILSTEDFIRIGEHRAVCCAVGLSRSLESEGEGTCGGC
jgi:hypothetical protein